MSLPRCVRSVGGPAAPSDHSRQRSPLTPISTMGGDDLIPGALPKGDKEYACGHLFRRKGADTWLSALRPRRCDLSRTESGSSQRSSARCAPSDSFCSSLNLLRFTTALATRCPTHGGVSSGVVPRGHDSAAASGRLDGDLCKWVVHFVPSHQRCAACPQGSWYQPAGNAVADSPASGESGCVGTGCVDRG